LWFTLLLALAAADRASAMFASTAKADRVVVEKKNRTLTLLRNGKALKSFRIALGQNPVGPKQLQGDHKTPEGTYVLDRRNERSRFYRSIHISYPSESDRIEAAKLGGDAGGDIMIHGLPNGFGWLGDAHRHMDWTDGCIAVTDAEMDEIWKMVPDGTIIEIEP
jgi:murein L,D-transpeptidase YafK